MNIIRATISALLLALASLAWQPIATAQDEKAQEQKAQDEKAQDEKAKPEAAPAESESAKPEKAAAPADTTPPGPGDQYSEKGADTCLGCHDAESDTLTFTTAAIFKSKHAFRADPRAPFGAGGLQCEACHGPGNRHATQGKKKLTINSQKSTSFMSVEQRNAPCLVCHSGSMRTGWHAGTHARSHLACTDCHRLHVEKDAVLARNTQPDVCFACHKQQRADFQKTSAHPVRFGQMACGDCHNPHGSTNTAMLIKPTINQTCYSCHAEKRGPMLWEHAPVSEDCTLCHSSHGAVRAALLNKSPPLLCQQCHTVAGHPSVPRTGAALPGNSGGGQIFLLAGACTNCHSQVHGSNHPAGAKLMR
jgi:DmsE family decaheme c-type cytochrome